MTDPIEEVGGVKGKSRKRSTDTWSEYLSGLGDFFTQPIINNTPPQGTKDTISSAQSTPPAKSPSKPSSSSELVNLGKKVWEFFALPIVDNTGTTGKAGGDGGKGIGSPALEPPFQIDMKQFAKLIKELQDILKKIADANMETEDEIRDAERKVMLFLVEYLKKQKAIREEGARDMKSLVIFRTQKGEKLGKELIETETLKNEMAKDQRWWGKVNKIVTWGAVAVTIIAVAVSIFFSGGTTTGILMVPLKIGLNVSQSILGVTSGCTQLMKAHLDKKVGEHKEKGIVLQEAHTTELFRVKQLTEQMHEWFGKSLTISGWMRQIAENDRQANLDMISISPPAAPAA